ncbi:MAG: NRDE family protein [Gillisia sp.]
MCTVTLTALNAPQKFVLTSNRDEAKQRETLPPSFEEYQGVKLLFPKDRVAGGTWLGISKHKRVLCLLNGEFVTHKRQPPYRKSRGLIVKDWLASQNIQKEIQEYNLQKIEPFTLIIADWQQKLKFMEFVWDGKNKHFRDLPLETHIWSSSPLYTPEMKKMRESWFEDFLLKKEITPDKLWEFHHSAGKEDKETGLIMERPYVRTQSISQVIASEEKCELKYEDLNSSEISVNEFNF